VDLFSLGPAWGAVLAIAFVGLVLAGTHLISLRVG
jgi:hypothetical protein